MGVVDYDQLKVLESLLNDEVINQEEYNAKVASLCGFQPTVSGKSANKDSKSANSTLYVLIAALVVLLLATICYMSTQNQQLLDDNEKITRDYEISKSKANRYKNVIKNDYLDSAVLVIEGDGAHYHRYNCPDFPARYTYWMYNREAAVDRGYVECPTCFGIDSNAYIDNQL